MNENEKMQAIVESGIDIVGSSGAAVVASAIGALILGPPGAALGAGVGTVLSSSFKLVGGEFLERWLSPREEARVGAGLVVAVERISQRLDEGASLRDDGFFDRDAQGQSQSDAILEGVLLRCKNEYEEKKLRFIANIYANVAFMPEVSAAGASWLLQEVQQLTYRQMCILKIVHEKGASGASWGPADGDPAFEQEYHMIDRMFSRDHSREATRLYEETGEGLRILGLSRVGRFCYDLMSLDEIPEDDLEMLAPRFPHVFE